MFKKREKRNKAENLEKIQNRRRARHTSNTLPLNRQHGGFSRFDTQQIDELQEVFNLIDQDRDGQISSKDLKDCLISLGQNPTESEIRSMVSEITPPFDLAHFLEMFGNKMECVDSEELIRNAFSCFDNEGDGYIDLDEFRGLLTGMGTRLTQQQVDEIFLHENITDESGKFRCDDVIKLFKYGGDD